MAARTSITRLCIPLRQRRAALHVRAKRLVAIVSVRSVVGDAQLAADRGEERQRLVVEPRHVGRDDREELGAHRGHAAKVPGPVLAAEAIGQPFHLHEADRRGRIHLGHRGREDGVHAETLADLQIGLERAGIPIEVFPPVELQRIDEDADEHRRTRFRSPADEGEMPLVQLPDGTAARTLERLGLRKSLDAQSVLEKYNANLYEECWP